MLTQSLVLSYIIIMFITPLKNVLTFKVPSNRLNIIYMYNKGTFENAIFEAVKRRCRSLVLFIQPD